MPMGSDQGAPVLVLWPGSDRRRGGTYAGHLHLPGLHPTGHRDSERTRRAQGAQ
jgi:hypothetical protein